MRSLRTVFDQWQILPVFFVCAVCGVVADEPVPNEINSPVEEPLVELPGADYTSPFHSASKSTLQSGDPLITLAQEAVDSTCRRYLDTSTNSPWQMMHGLLALRQDFQVSHEDKIVSGLEWIATGPTYENEPWFEKTQFGGRAHPYSHPWAFEGHANQFLAILSMSALPVDYQFRTPRGPITIADMLQHAKKTVNVKDEPTWTLWALSRYLPPDASWRNAKGEPWSIERLVAIQTKKQVDGTACGGTHGLFALAHARNVYLQNSRPLRGVWLEAEYKIRQHIRIVQTQQNSNGMLSSNFFRGREHKDDFNKRMASAGHLLEFLMIALPQNELNEPWVRRAIEAAANDLIQHRKSYVKCSPLYHSVNALKIYLGRVEVKTAAAPPAGASAPMLRSANDGAPGLRTTPVTRIGQSKELSGPMTKPIEADSPAKKIRHPEAAARRTPGTKPTEGPAPEINTGPTTETPAETPANPDSKPERFFLTIPSSDTTEPLGDPVFDEDRSAESATDGPTTGVPPIPSPKESVPAEEAPEPPSGESGWKKTGTKSAFNDSADAVSESTDEDEEGPIIEPPLPPVDESQGFVVTRDSGGGSRALLETPGLCPRN